MFHLKNIRYRYVRDEAGDAMRIRGVEIDDLRIAETGVTAVIGPSGSGKTTLLSILAGFLKPNDLSAKPACLFDGKDYSEQGHAVGDVAFVFQSPMLLGSANAMVNILQGRVVKPTGPKIDDTEFERIRTVTAELGLLGSGDHLLHKRANNLSGGEKQRVAILRALIADPRAVLCDEPTSSLDEHNATQALNALHHWSEMRERPVIWITHNMEQAARYADHHIFMSRGRIHRPTDAQSERLASEDFSTRLEALREVVGGLAGGGLSDTAPIEQGMEGAPVAVGRMRYASWIAHALSTDASSGGLSSLDGDSGGKMPAWPRQQTDLLQRLDSSTPPGTSGPARLWRTLVSYTGYGIALIVLVLMAQIFAAVLAQSLARDYSETRLQDPSVARVVFDHFVFGQSDGGTQPPELFPGEPLASLEADLRAEISNRAPEADAANVAVFGRRVIDGSSLLFQSGNAQCAGRWYPSASDTVALSIDDPILNQTEFAAGDSRLQPDLAAVRSRIDALSPAIGADIPVVLIDWILFGRLQDYCELDRGEPVRALWAVGDIGKLTPIEVEVVGAVTRFPPLYPLQPEIIVFESGYQQAMNRLNAGNPGPFRVATAYIPIEGFEPAADVIRDRGYRVRDDSSAAVQTLQGVARAADTLPPWIIGFNVAAAAFLVLIVLDNVLTLNKSVLALFVAHGYTKRDILMIMLLHLFPAIAAAGLVLAVLAFLGTALVADLTPSSPEDVAAFGKVAYGLTLAIVVATWLIVTLAVVPWWWKRTRSRLKSYLQE